LPESGAVTPPREEQDLRRCRGHDIGPAVAIEVARHEGVLPCALRSLRRHVERPVAPPEEYNNSTGLEPGHGEIEPAIAVEIGGGDGARSLHLVGRNRKERSRFGDERRAEADVVTAP